MALPKRPWGGDPERVQCLDEKLLAFAYDEASRDDKEWALDLLDYIAHLEAAREGLRQALRDHAATPETTAPILEQLIGKKPPDTAVAIADAAMRLMAGTDGWSVFTGIAVVGTYQVGATRETARGKAEGVYYKHPEYLSDIPAMVQRLRQMADETEHDYEQRFGEKMGN